MTPDEGTPTASGSPSPGKGPSRRVWLGLAAGAAASTFAPIASAAIAADSLDGLARAKGLRFGAAIGVGDLAEPACRQIFEAECGVIVAENQMKWPAVEPAPGVYTFERADQVAGFASKAGLRLRGHNLLWQHPKWLPTWVTAYDFGADPRRAAEQLLSKHIRAECGRYRGRVSSWDVINETIDADTGQMRETVFTHAMGPAVIDFAFHAAREAAPETQLVYNDYMGWEAHSANHRTGVLRLLEGLKARNVPVGALGLQSHIAADPDALGGVRERDWRRFLDEVAAMGFELLITEFDVNDSRLPSDPALRDQGVADAARAYLDLTLSYPQVKQVLTWGVVDHHSWMQSYAPRADGLPERPLIYDDHYRPKPMRQAIADAFRAAPARG
jgi:endo-1,4-beta-xylanase